VNPRHDSAVDAPRRWLPPAVLLAGLGLSFFTAYYAWRTVHLRNRSEFDGTAQHATAAIDRTLQTYVTLLRGLAAYFAAETNVTAAGFSAYVKRIGLPANYPGIQGIGFSLKTSPAEEPMLQGWMASQGFTNFHIWPKTPRGQYHTILFLEPHDARNLAALGYDMFTDPVRRRAMETARDTGYRAASGKVTLVQEIVGPQQAGFLVYAPVYHGGAIPSSVEERRRMLKGFVYGPFRMGDLVTSVLGEPFLRSMDIHIYDGAGIDPEKQLFSSVVARKPPALWFETVQRTVLFLDVGGRTWTLAINTPPRRMSGWWIAPTFLFAGVGLSLVLFYITSAEARARRQAEAFAAQLQVSEVALRNSEERLRDYTAELERRVAERTADLRQSIHSHEDLLYHVAHDLRAPLRSMASFTKILLQDYAAKLDGRAQDYAGRISNSAHFMDELVQDLLAYGHLSHSEVKLTAVDLEHQVDAVLEQFSAQLKSQHVQVEVRRPLPSVKASPAIVSQIILHLIDNALKFVPPDRKARLCIWAEVNGRVRLWIEDNGIGMSPEYHGRIFRLFERLHGRDEFSGTGIGLAIVAKGAERLGGRAGVESVPGSGSRFWVELPAAGEPAG